MQSFKLPEQFLFQRVRFLQISQRCTAYDSVFCEASNTEESFSTIFNSNGAMESECKEERGDSSSMCGEEPFFLSVCVQGGVG